MKRRITLITLGLLLVTGVAAGFVFQDNLKAAVSDIQMNIKNKDTPKLVFDTAKYPDWATTGNTWVNPDDLTDDSHGSKDDLPVSSINIMQCETGSDCSNLVEKCEPWHDDKPACKALSQSTFNTHCFVIAAYKDKVVDPDTAIAAHLERQKSFDNYMTVQEVGVKTLTMETPEGTKTYQHHYYDYSSKTGEAFKRGNARGYVALAKGHIEVQSICNEANQLDETLPILSALSFKK